MDNESISVMAGLRNDRIDGDDRKLFPRYSDVPVTSYLDVCDLIVDKSEEVEGERLPSIGSMLECLGVVEK